MQDKINYDIQFYELELKRTKSKYRKRDLAKCIKRLKKERAINEKLWNAIHGQQK